MRRGTAAAALVEALVAVGVDHAFTVPGESFLGVLGALRDDPRIRVVATRHENGAAFMAEAYGKLTRRPALCLATRAVGAANLAIGVHTALQDSTPMIAILGQVPTRWRHREAFQEADLPTMFRPLAKWAVEVERGDRLGELGLRAARLAVDGRPGPVVLALPEDILDEEVELPSRAPVTASRPVPNPCDVAAALQLLRQARRPLLLAGLGVLADGAVDALVELAEREECPVVTSWRRPDAFPNDHRLYLGMTGLSSPPSVPARLREADAVLVLGCRLDEITTFGYSVPTGRWAHVDVDPQGLVGDSAAEIVLRTGVAEFLAVARGVPGPEGSVVGSGAGAVGSWGDVGSEGGVGSEGSVGSEGGGVGAEGRAVESAAGGVGSEGGAGSAGWAAWAAERRAATAADRERWEAETTPGRGMARAGFADQQAVAGHLRAGLPPDAIVVTDAGNFSGWGARYLRWNRPGSFVGPTSGAMGYALPGAIGAKLAAPDRPVVALAGDGGFLMTASEIETAVRERVPVVSVVFDNARYGTIGMHQAARLAGPQVATELGPVDFAALTESLGGRGFRVDDADDFPTALDAALHAGVPATIAVRTDPDQNSVAQDARASATITSP